MSDRTVARAEALLALDRHLEALEAVGPVLAHSPGHVGAHLVAGWATRGLHRPAEAWDHARAAAQAAPDHGEALALMALSDLETGDPDRLHRARELGRRAVAVDLWNPLTHLALVHTLLGDDRTVGEARAAARRAVSIAPGSATMLALAAKAEMHSGRGTLEAWEQEEARRLLLEALRLDPSHAEARRLLAALDSTWGRGSSGLRQVHDVLRANPLDRARADVDAWVQATARVWSLGLGVSGVAMAVVLLTDDSLGAIGFVRFLGAVVLLAAVTRLVSARMAAGPAVTRTVVRGGRPRRDVAAPVGAVALLGCAGWCPRTWALAAVAGALIVLGAGRWPAVSAHDRAARDL
ncbi:MAG: hypothetical protein ACRCYR_01320 [Phycicoccus sp.]